AALAQTRDAGERVGQLTGVIAAPLGAGGARLVVDELAVRPRAGAGRGVLEDAAVAAAGAAVAVLEAARAHVGREGAEVQAGELAWAAGERSDGRGERVEERILLDGHARGVVDHEQEVELAVERHVGRGPLLGRPAAAVVVAAGGPRIEHVPGAA